MRFIVLICLIFLTSCSINFVKIEKKAEESKSYYSDLICEDDFLKRVQDRLCICWQMCSNDYCRAGCEKGAYFRISECLNHFTTEQSIKLDK